MMLLRLMTALAATVCVHVVAYAQERATQPAVGYQDSFQIGFFPNGAIGGGDGSVFFPFTNAGIHAGPAFPVTSSDICVNAYIMASDGAMASCCACRVPANSFAYVLDAPYNYPGTDVTVKLLATLPARDAPGLPPAQCLPQYRANTGLGVPLGFASGMVAWTEALSDLNTSFYEKDRFSPAPLNDAEVRRLTQQCQVASRCTCLPAVSGLSAASAVTSRARNRNPFGLK